MKHIDESMIGRNVILLEDPSTHMPRQGGVIQSINEAAQTAVIQLYPEFYGFSIANPDGLRTVDAYLIQLADSGIN